MGELFIFQPKQDPGSVGLGTTFASIKELGMLCAGQVTATFSPNPQLRLIDKLPLSFPFQRPENRGWHFARTSLEDATSDSDSGFPLLCDLDPQVRLCHSSDQR